jgi:hypothetical protein
MGHATRIYVSCEVCTGAVYHALHFPKQKLTIGRLIARHKRLLMAIDGFETTPTNYTLRSPAHFQGATPYPHQPWVTLPPTKLT